MGFAVNLPGPSGVVSEDDYTKGQQVVLATLASPSIMASPQSVPQGRKAHRTKGNTMLYRERSTSGAKQPAHSRTTWLPEVPRVACIRGNGAGVVAP